MPDNLSIYCFGNFKVELNGENISAFETDKTRALLVYLAVEAEHSLRRSHIAGMLWPDDSEERALHNLRQTLSYLRKALGDTTESPYFILSDRECIQLNPQANIWVDCLVFSDFLQTALKTYQSQNGNGLFHIRYLKKAITLFQGEFLSHFSIHKSILFEEWAILQREEKNLKAIRALTLLSIYHEKRAEYHQAVEYVSMIIELCPWDETARNRMIRLLGMDGQWAAAKSHFMVLKRYMKEQLSVEPSEDSIILYEQINQASTGKTIIKPEYPARDYSIPKNPTSFVGREDDLNTVMDLLVRPENRLVTITGPGGIGKTRLAQEIAGDFSGVFQDGVNFVSLIPAKNMDQIITLIAQTIGITFSDQSDNLEILLGHLRESKSLLVLDNFEHLMVDESNIAFIDRFINTTKFLKFLVTSREILNLVQEQVYLLSGLTYPQNSSLSLELIQSFDAVQLFLKRTSQKLPGFTLTENNKVNIAQICGALEGMPLGVELAAATIYEQGIEKVADIYKNNLDTLETRMHNFQTRHKSLNVAFDISWELLTKELQEKLFGLSFFLDGFTVFAANAVAGVSASDLATLVSKSFLRMEMSGRYSIHEAIRQFINKKSLPAADPEQLMEKHACFFADFLSGIQTDLKNSGQTFALNNIQTELGNISLCWKWILDHNRVDLMLKCIDSLYQYFYIRSLFNEGITWFKQVVELMNFYPEDEQILGKLLWRLGSMACMIHNNQLVFDSLLKSQQILKRAGEYYELAYCHIYLGWAYQKEKDFDTAGQYTKLALQYFTENPDDNGLSQSYLLAGAIGNRQGDFNKSVQYFELAYSHSKKTGNPRNLMVIINRLADIACYEGNYARAETLFLESLKISEELDDRYNQAIMLNNLGTIFHIKSDYSSAKTYYEQSLQIAQDIGDLDGTALALNNLGELSTCQQDYESARSFSEEALGIARKLNEYWTIIVCLNSLGEIYCGLLLFDKSKQYFQEALKLAIEINGLDLVARVLINLARVYQLSGQKEIAITMLIAGISHSATEQDSREKAFVWLGEMGVLMDYNINDELMRELLKNNIFEML